MEIIIINSLEEWGHENNHGFMSTDVHEQGRNSLLDFKINPLVIQTISLTVYLSVNESLRKANKHSKTMNYFRKTKFKIEDSIFFCLNTLGEEFLSSLFCSM